MKRFMFLMLVILFVSFIGCEEAKVASRNLSIAAEQFELSRRIVFFNGITDKYLLSIEGRCSIEVQKSQDRSGSCLIERNRKG